MAHSSSNKIITHNNAGTTDAANSAIFTTSQPCQYHRGNAVSIFDLSLSHDNGRVLFQAADLSLPHGKITGLVGTNGAGKTSLAQLLASKVLDGFPASLTVEYLAAADDDDGRHHHRGDDDNNDNSFTGSLALLPREYIQSRIQARLDILRQTIQELEQVMEEENVEQVEETADELSYLYDVEESIVETMERETDLAMERVGIEAHAKKKLGQLSCGWRYKCRLVAALLSHPELCIIDEPSFLDASSVDWLMEQLQHMAKTDNAIVLFISHKEALLEALCDRIVHIHSGNQTLTTYNSCSYSNFRATLESEIQRTAKTLDDTHDKLEAADKSLKKVQAVCKKREANFRSAVQQGEDKRWIKGKNKEAKQKADRSAASKLKKTQLAVEQAEEIKNKAKREQVIPLVIEGMPAAERTLISLEMVGFKYDEDDDIGNDNWLFQNVDTVLDVNDRVLLQGNNGCGKTTLVKLILGELKPTEGSVHRSIENVLYFPQTALHQLLQRHGQQTALEFLLNDSNVIKTETQARCHLGELGLAKDLALNPVHTLSAGQRVRLWLAKELLCHPKPALLILDEMSENVDVETRKSLVEMFQHFKGAVLVISHDPDFCESFSYTKLWALWRHGMQVTYPE